MLDLFYLAIGCVFLLLLWAFTKACDKLKGEQRHGLYHCRNRVVGIVYLPDLRASPSGKILRRAL